MVSMLQGVVERGTGTAVTEVGKPIAGKTGTINESYDTWFIGFSPDLAAGVYHRLRSAAHARRKGDRRQRRGADLPRFHERGAEGRAGDALPHTAGHPAGAGRSDDRHARRSRRGKAILEAFKPGTEPTGQVTSSRTWLSARMRPRPISRSGGASSGGRPGRTMSIDSSGDQTDQQRTPRQRRRRPAGDHGEPTQQPNCCRRHHAVADEQPRCTGTGPAGSAGRGAGGSGPAPPPAAPGTDAAAASTDRARSAALSCLIRAAPIGHVPRR